MSQMLSKYDRMNKLFTNKKCSGKKTAAVNVEFFWIAEHWPWTFCLIGGKQNMLLHYIVRHAFDSYEQKQQQQQ